MRQPEESAKRAICARPQTLLILYLHKVSVLSRHIRERNVKASICVLEVSKIADRGLMSSARERERERALEDGSSSSDARGDVSAYCYCCVAYSRRLVCLFAFNFDL